MTPTSKSRPHRPAGNLLISVVIVLSVAVLVMDRLGVAVITEVLALGYQWLILLAGVALLIGAANVAAMHFWRIQTGQRDWVLSLVLLGNTALAIYEALKVNLLLPLEWFSLYPYTIGIYTLTLMFIMTRRYVGALGQVELANASLVRRLREREAELEQSYQRL